MSALVGWFVWRHACYWSLRPAATVDLIAQYDRQATALPENERSWIEYRSGLQSLASTEPGQSLADVLDVKPSDPNWLRAVEFFGRNRPVVDRLMAATARASLGFQYQNPEAPLETKPPEERIRGVRYERRQNAPTSPSQDLMLVPVGYVEELHIVLRVLTGRLRISQSRRDWADCTDALAAIAGVARQVVDAPDYASTQCAGVSLAAECFGAVQEFLHDDVGELDSEQLQRTEAELSRVAVASIVARTACWGRLQAVVQQHFSDDGEGSGVPLGDDVVRSAYWSGWSRWVEIPKTQTWPFDDWDVFVWEMKLRAPFLATQLADRRESLEILKAMAAEDTAFRQSPDWAAQMQLTTQTWLSVIAQPNWNRRYGLLDEVIQMSAGDRRRAAHVTWAAAMNLEAARLRIAIERFRRNNAAWPPDLGALVPEFLPTAPLDPFDGRPLRFRLATEGPFVYSVGSDKFDDTAATAGSTSGVAPYDVVVVQPR